MEGGVSSLRVTRNNIQTIIDDQYGVNTRFVIRKRDMPIEKAGTDLYYLDNLYPNANLDAVRLLTINYYDRYAVPDQGIENLDPQNAPSPIPSQLNYTDDVQGLQTSGKVRVLGTDQWISNASYYDEKGRGIYGGGYNEYLDTHDYTYSVYNFTNQVTQTTSLQEKDGFSIYTTDEFTYDHRGRLLTQTQKINGLISELIVNNKYDELGQLKNKKVGGDVASSPENSSGLQQVDFSYNTRGWMTGINDSNNLGADLFGFNLSYNNPGNSNATPLYNGNISETEWKTEKDNTLRKYVYGYDALNRIKNADYSGGMMESYPNGTPISEDFSVGKISYDRNGNITALQRSGAVLDINSSQVIDVDIIDKLDYHYQPKSNKLLSVGDVAHTEGFKDGNQNGDDYTYDVNGNLTRDKNKGITEITYNHLNLPEKIVFGNAGQMANSNKINYIYTANGTKLEKEVTQLNGNTTQTSTTQYAAGMIYKDGDLEFFAQPEGYVQFYYGPGGKASYSYVYQYKDHLGNIRLSYSDSDGNGSIDTSTEIVEENNYYPFGLEHKGYNNVTLQEYNYKQFQGQEWTEDLGLNIHEWKYRISDPAIGRFWQVDPLAEDYVYNGVYNFSENRVIDAYELEGAEAVVITEEGTYSKLNVGHTFVTVGSGENTVAYTYGRYAELGKDKGSLNPTNLSGEGVLIRLAGQDAINMVDEYVNDYGGQAFEFTNANESEVAGFFEEQFNSSDKIPETGSYAGDERARVIDTYSLSGNNCTTISCEGISAGTGGNMTYKKEYKNNPKLAGGKGTVEMNIISDTPRGVQTQLNEASRDPNSGVKNVTENYRKKE